MTFHIRTPEKSPPDEAFASGGGFFWGSTAGGAASGPSARLMDQKMPYARILTDAADCGRLRYVRKMICGIRGEKDPGKRFGYNSFKQQKYLEKETRDERIPEAACRYAGR